MGLYQKYRNYVVPNDLLSKLRKLKIIHLVHSYQIRIKINDIQASRTKYMTFSLLFIKKQFDILLAREPLQIFKSLKTKQSDVFLAF